MPCSMAANWLKECPSGIQIIFDRANTNNYNVNVISAREKSAGFCIAVQYIFQSSGDDSRKRLLELISHRCLPDRAKEISIQLQIISQQISPCRNMHLIQYNLRVGSKWRSPPVLSFRPSQHEKPPPPWFMSHNTHIFFFTTKQSDYRFTCTVP